MTDNKNTRFDFPNKVIDNLYYGNSKMADKIENLRSLGITHIVNCDGAQKKLERFEEHQQEFVYLALDLVDGDCDIQSHLESTIAFIQKAIEDNGTVFVHCKYGISRSGSIVVAYIMHKFGWDYDTAWDFVRTKRANCCPNQFFREQLIKFFSNQSTIDQST